MVTLATYETCIDLNSDGDFSDPNEDISGDVRELEWSRGRDNELNKTDTGEAKVTVTDTTGKYIPQNVASALYPNLTGGRPVRIRATHLGSTYDLFLGSLDDVLPEPHIETQHAFLPCKDGLDRLARDKISMGLQKVKLSGELFAEALDRVNWDAVRRSLDTGIDAYPMVFAERQECRRFQDDIALSEFGFYYVDGRGYLCWEDRHHRLKAPHTTSQWTCSADKYVNIEPTESLKGIRNVIIIDAQPFALSGSVTDIWTLSENKDNIPADSPLLQPGESYDYWAKFLEIADSVVPPVATTDYLGNTAIDGSGVDKTAQLAVSATIFAQSAKITVTNNDAAPVYLTMLKIRGELYVRLERLEIVEDDATSIGNYGEWHLPISLPYYQSSQIIRDTAKHQLATKKDPWSGYRVTLFGDTDEILTQILTRKLSDRITLQNATYGIDDDFHIDKMEHHVREDGYHECRWTLSRADDQMYWVLGVSALGITTRLAY